MFQKISGAKKELWIRKGVSRSVVGNLLSHVAKKHRGEPFNLSESFWYGKTVLDKRWEGVKSRLCIKNFQSRCTERIREELFNVSGSVWCGKLYG